MGKAYLVKQIKRCWVAFLNSKYCSASLASGAM